MRRIALYTLLGLMIAATPACKKDGSGASGAGGKGKTVGAAKSALEIFPEDTAFVLGVNISKLTGSKLWQTFSPMFMADAKEDLGKLKDACGLDPLVDIKSFAAGTNADMDSEKAVLVVQGSFDEAKITKCVTAMAEKEGKKASIKTEGKISAITAEGESKTMYIGWAASDTIVVTRAALEGDKTSLAALFEGKSSAKNNKDLAAVMGKVDTGSTLWMAATVTGKLKSQMDTGDDPQPVAGWANIEYTKELKVSAGGRFANEKDAKAMGDKANKELESVKSDPKMGPYLKTLKVEAKGADLSINMSLDEEQVDKLVQEVLPMLMMMGMGGMGGMGGSMGGM
jgi:hypothetical protein